MRLYKIAIAAASVVALTALQPGAAHADTTTANAILTAGGFSVTTNGSAFQFGTQALTGVDTPLTAASSGGTASGAWAIVNARGTDTSWSVSIYASTDLVSAAGASGPDSSARSILKGQMAVTTGSVTPSAGSDAAALTTANVANMPAAGSPATIVTANVGGSKGTFTFTPQLTINVPAKAYRSNCNDNSSPCTAWNPYISTLNVTIS